MCVNCELLFFVCRCHLEFERCAFAIFLLAIAKLFNFDVGGGDDDGAGDDAEAGARLSQGVVERENADTMRVPLVAS